MTRDELLTKLRALEHPREYDPERWHLVADDLLLEFINDSEIGEAFSKIDKWYA